MRTLWILAAIDGFVAVAIGAFGAHGMKGLFDASGEAAKREAWWTTASHYHLAHAIAIGLAAALAAHAPGRLATWSGVVFFVGTLVFSGSLYVMAATGTRWLGAVTPIGGLLFLAGWALLAAAAWGLPS
jgi:uncharacterized membrane protein YgdD (TMEM256/DUF423 family)